MGLLDDAASVVSGRTSHSHHGSKHHKHRHHKSRSPSPSRHRHSHSHSQSHSQSHGIASIFGGGDNHKHNSSRASFFSLPSASRSSFFGFSRPSYYKRSSRPNFVHRAYRRLKRLLRDLVHYAKRHPAKVFVLVLMPLITGGALTALLARFGLRLPAGLERLLGLAARAGSAASGPSGLVGEAVRLAGGAAAAGFGTASASIERGRDGGLQWERKRVERDGYGYGYGGGGGGGGGRGAGWGDSLMGVAKMFI